MSRLLLILPLLFGAASAQTVGSCPVFPASNIWNTAIDQMPVRPDSATLVNTIGATKPLHPDFGSGLYDGGPIGIPYVLVANQARVSVRFTYSAESDPGPYPIPANAPIEGGSNSTGDRHVLVLDQGSCLLYELWSAYPQTDGSWNAGSGAIFDLKSNQLRPDTWTSADAAGLPILPGLLRYDEVLAGEIKHAIRFTAPQTRNQYVWPARHYASSLTAATYPPMGRRFRLRADFDISKFSATNQVILRALKKYGIILADNGSSWYLSGSPDPRWNNDDLHALSGITGSAFEAVDVSQLMVDRNSGQAGTSGSAPPAIAGVLNAASFQGAISTGAWISIFGTNLASTTRQWRSDEIVNGKLPTQLDGVGVSIGGVPAALSYISPTQLNVQVPDTTSGTSVPIQVTSSGGSANYSASIQTLAPALFLFDAANRRYAAAQHADYSAVGPVGLYPGSTPARPGETIILYGTGFGPTTPPLSAGYLVTRPAPLLNQATARIGGLDVVVAWAGMAQAGVYQFNVTIPASVPDGDAVLVIQTGGSSTQDSAYLAVGH
ncbi:MAG TPA: IPT/TIG domain-containing protein [Candidatus Acidoferrales bacterium]|nr:IPT/TIG domain-containing protein [Candidatus Acidoferrales bacterium]